MYPGFPGTFGVDWCLYRHLCILPEHFGKKRPMDRKFDHCVSQKAVMSCVATSQTPVVSRLIYFYVLPLLNVEYNFFKMKEYVILICLLFYFYFAVFLFSGARIIRTKIDYAKNISGVVLLIPLLEVGSEI